MVGRGRGHPGTRNRTQTCVASRGDSPVRSVSGRRGGVNPNRPTPDPQSWVCPFIPGESNRLAYQASAYLRHAAYDLWIYAFSAFAPLWVRPNSRRRGILEFHHLMQDALADAILRLCEDKDLRSTLGRSGRAWAERFSWDRVARDQEAVYLNVMASRERFDCVSSAL